jgi:hypothetical protein
MTRSKSKLIFATLVAFAIAIYIPGVSLAQSSQLGQAAVGQSYQAGQQGQVNPNQPPGPPAAVNPNQTGRQTPEPKGGIATVVGVDQPENCLRIRTGPGSYYDVIGCANMGDQLNITGVWTSNDWAQTADNGWVYGPQIQTDLRPPQEAYSRSPSYVVSEPVTPDYEDWAYLPDYGYDTYWDGGIPLFLYNIGVWNRFHPWWWHRGHQAWWWQDGHHGRRPWNATAFNNFARTGTNRNFVTNRSNISTLNRAGTRRSFTTNRSNISPSNVNRLNANSFRSGSTNAFRSRTFSSPNTFRSGSANAFRSRSFSSPNRIRSGSVNTFRSQSFSSPSMFRSGSFGGRQFSGVGRSGGFSSPHIGGGGFHAMGGGGRHR